MGLKTTFYLMFVMHVSGVGNHRSSLFFTIMKVKLNQEGLKIGIEVT